MKLSFIALFSLALAITATPVALNFVEGDAPLEKRSSETVYLSNCNIFGTPVYSQINYYSNGANSQNGEQPDDTCYYPSASYVTWEGNAPRAALFTPIQDGAQTHTTTSIAIKTTIVFSTPLALTPLPATAFITAWDKL
ncbi:hypothetical protein V490_02568 [Pseudogymnoascus sp. VKM F-3557]|nr:hypothetical protein V490_02568 [Pseudogymnoascus sp. VKM F-3557]